MRLTIIPKDGYVSINGKGYSNIDLSFLDNSIHAVQWKNTFGEIERWNPETEQMVANEPITDIEQFQPAIDLWTQKDAEVKAQQAEIARLLGAQ